MLIVSIFLLAIATMGAVSASGDVSDDAIAAVEPTDDTPVQSVDEIEAVDEAIAQSADDEKTSFDDDSQNPLTGDDPGVKALVSNVTAHDNPKGVISIECYSQKSGTVKVYIDQSSEPVKSIKLEGGKFIYNSTTSAKSVGYTLEDLGITYYRNFTISAVFHDSNELKTYTLCNEPIGVLFLDATYDVDTIFDVDLNFFLAYDFKGNISATLNGVDLGEIELEYDDYQKCLCYTLDLNTSVLRLKDNVVKIYANDPVMGPEHKELTFDCNPILLYPNTFYNVTFSNPPQFFSIGEEFYIGIQVPKEIIGKLYVYNATYDYETSKYIRGTKLLNSTDIVNGYAITTIAVPYANDMAELWLEYETNKGNGHVNDDVEIISNNPFLNVTVEPREYIVGDVDDVTVNFTSPEEGFLEIYTDRQGESFEGITSFCYNISYLDVGKHIIRVKFESGDVKYSKCFAINVKPWTPTEVKVNTKLSAKGVSTTYTIGKYFYIYLKDEYNHPLAYKYVNVKFGSKAAKNYRTDGNGRIAINVGSMVPGTYSTLIRFVGDSDYNASLVTTTIKVAKSKTQLSASKKVFKANAKTKRVTATFKTIKGLAIKNTYVTLTIAKKIYKIKTNNRGIATFTIKLAKKGSYLSTVKFAGNAYYYKTSRNFYIIIK